MQDQEVAQKIGHLHELMNNPARKEGTVLRIFHDLFELTCGGRDLSPSTAEWLSEAASFFLSPQLLRVLFNSRLEVYAFHFAALNFTEVDDVVDDLCNGEVLKSIHSFPPGAFNKLKRELLAPHQQDPPNQTMIETASASETKKTAYNSLIVNFMSGKDSSSVMESLKDLVNDQQFSPT